MNPIENKRAPKRILRSIVVKAGSPKSGDAHGDGTLIVVPQKNKAVLKGTKEQPSKEGQSISKIERCREGKRNFLHRKVCEMQKADQYLGILRDDLHAGRPLRRKHVSRSRT